MRAWMVRGGSAGEREEVALEQDRAIAGWPELGDISRFQTKEELRRAIDLSYDNELSPAVLGNWTGQLWRFVKEIANGDIVVMPLKTQPNKFAIGRVSGDYFFESDEADPGMRHSRPVLWEGRVERDSIRPDLRASLGSLLTVCELSRNSAAERLSNVLNAGYDPGDGDDEVQSLDQLVAEAPKEVEVRTLLSMWGYQRRSSSIIEEVTDSLASLGLLAIPSIADGAIDSLVRIVPAPGTSDKERTASPDVEKADAKADEVIGGSVRYAISTLTSAKCKVAAVRAKDSLESAVTVMALNDYSQLAVVDNENTLVAGLTWEAVALALLSGKPKLVDEVMIQVPSALPDEELLSHSETIYHHGFVFVRDSNGTVSGIVTASDLTKRFGDDHRPLVLLEEIESRIKHRINSFCTVSEIEAEGVRIPPYGMTMGTYVKILESPTLWAKLTWGGIDQQAFTEAIAGVRNLRNQFMHFSPDPIQQEEIDLLQRILRMLRLITKETRD